MIVGARAAGASTALLLAKAGLNVLAVDRQSYGSDTLSTHALMGGAVGRLAQWELLDRVWESGTPIISRGTHNYGGDKTTLEIKPRPGVAGLAAPRRTVLDPILVDAARDAGACVLHNTRLLRLVHDVDGRVIGLDLMLADGVTKQVSADLIVGADGLRSSVARAVAAPVTRRGAAASAYTMQYYTDLDVDRDTFAWMWQPGLGGGVIPTSDDAVCIFTGMTQQAFTEAKSDVVGVHGRNAHRLDPVLGSAVDQATPISAIRSFPGTPGQFRKPFGPGWALVGDAGYFKDPYAGHGISDAFRDAELLTTAILTGDFATYEARRDELSMPLFHALERIASYQWNLGELPALHLALSKAMRAEENANPPTKQTGLASAA